MPRRPRPWYRKERSAYYAQIDGQKIKLVEGPKNSETRELAEQVLLETLLLRSKNRPVESEQTVASVIDRYLVHARKSLSPRTLYERNSYLQRFAEDHGEKEISRCIPLYLTEWIDAHDEWASDWTRATAVGAVQSCFNWAAEQRLIGSNPFAGVRRATGQARRPMTDEEFRALLRATASDYGKRQRPTPAARFRQLLLFIRMTGCRPCEASQLRWDQVNAEAGEVVLTRHKTARTQKDPKPRVIMLDPLVVRLLIWILQHDRQGDYVFRNHRGTTWNRSSLSLRIQRLRKRAGVQADCKLYGLRHGFGTRAIVNGVDLKTLAELMGHTTTRMTEHYLHLAGQRAHLGAAMLRVNAAGPTPGRKGKADACAKPAPPVAAEPPAGADDTRSGAA